MIINVCVYQHWEPSYHQQTPPSGNTIFILVKCFMFITILQYIPRNMHTNFALLCFVVVIHWLIFPYPSGLLHWHCGNLTIAPVPAKQPWWIWINTSCEFIMNDCITTTKQSTTKPCAYFLGYTVHHLYTHRLVGIRKSVLVHGGTNGTTTYHLVQAVCSLWPL